MKILFIINTLNAGGAERVVSVLANSWHKIGHEIIIVKFDEDLPFYELAEGITVETPGRHRANTTFFEKILFKLGNLATIRKNIKKYQPDIAISFTDLTNMLSIFASLFTKTKLIISERIHFAYQTNLIWRLLRNITYRLSDGLVVLSQFDFNKYTFVRNRKVIPNPAWLLNQSVDFSKKKRMILSIGRLDEQKGYDIFLQVLAKIDQNLLKDWKIMIIGEGGLRQQLKQLATELGIADKVEFLGRQKNVVEFYEQAGIFVSTSRSEGFPNALAEALTMGCACLATNCLTGPSELIMHQKNGLLVTVDNIDEIKESLEQLLTNEPLRLELGKNAKESAQRYAVNNVVKMWEEFIAEIRSNIV